MTSQVFKFHLELYVTLLTVVLILLCFMSAAKAVALLPPLVGSASGLGKPAWKCSITQFTRFVTFTQISMLVYEIRAGEIAPHGWFLHGEVFLQYSTVDLLKKTKHLLSWFVNCIFLSITTVPVRHKASCSVFRYFQPKGRWLTQSLHFIHA